MEGLKSAPAKYEETEVSLDDLLTYDNPNLGKYNGFISAERAEKEDAGYPLDSFSEILATDLRQLSPETHEKVMEYLRSKLEGKTLVDVGGGEKLHMMQLAESVGAKTYINVDIRPNGEKVSNPTRGIRLPQEPNEKTEVIYVDADMLDFVARVRNGSCCFIVNGIDISVLQNEQYRKALREELIRATEDGGILFGAGSDIWEPMDDSRLKFVTEDLGLANEDHPEMKVVCEKVST